MNTNTGKDMVDSLGDKKTNEGSCLNIRKFIQAGKGCLVTDAEVKQSGPLYEVLNSSG